MKNSLIDLKARLLCGKKLRLGKYVNLWWDWKRIWKEKLWKIVVIYSDCWLCNFRLQPGIRMDKWWGNHLLRCCPSWKKIELWLVHVIASWQGRTDFSSRCSPVGGRGKLSVQAPLYRTMGRGQTEHSEAPQAVEHNGCLCFLLFISNALWHYKDSVDPDLGSNCSFFMLTMKLCTEYP